MVHDGSLPPPPYLFPSTPPRLSPSTTQRSPSLPVSHPCHPSSVSLSSHAQSLSEIQGSKTYT